MKYALLVIDMNKGSFDPNARGGILFRAKEYLVPCINELATAFRARSLPVVWVTQRYHDDLSDALPLQRKRSDKSFAEGSNGWELLPELSRQISDFLVVKRGYDAFYNTDLDSILQDQGVTSLVIAGVNTYACVRQTTMGACERLYDPIVWPQKGIAASLPQFEENTLQYMVAKPGQLGLVEGLLTNEEIIARLGT